MPRLKNNRGYWEVKVDGHPYANNKGYVREHRLILEKKLREEEPNHPALIELDGEKYLRPEYDGNHKNLNKLDNRPINLEAKRHDEHAREHIRIREEVKVETIEERKEIGKKIFNNIIKDEMNK